MSESLEPRGWCVICDMPWDVAVRFDPDEHAYHTFTASGTYVFLIPEDHVECTKCGTEHHVHDHYSPDCRNPVWKVFK